MGKQSANKIKRKSAATFATELENAQDSQQTGRCSNAEATTGSGRESGESSRQSGEKGTSKPGESSTSPKQSRFWEMLTEGEVPIIGEDGPLKISELALTDR
jgi:hypothetical protein